MKRPTPSEDQLRDAADDYLGRPVSFGVLDDFFGMIRKYYVVNSGYGLGDISLLDGEMRFARAKGRIRTADCQLLVLLAGFSPEPLLQSVCAHDPEKVLLVLNRSYGKSTGAEPISGEEYGEGLRDLIDSLKPAGLTKNDIEFLSKGGDAPGRVVSDDPSMVFRGLLESLKDEPPDAKTVIDVTGGKKSMVAGAFLYAAYSRHPISYVDFDDDAYNRAKGRPYGYGCKIGVLSNPVRMFGLGEWSRVRQSYEHYNFRNASDELSRLRSRMAESPEEGGESLFEERHLDAVDRLKAILECYDLWDNGDFAGALRKNEEIKKFCRDFSPPTTVEKLGGIWPKSEKEQPEGIAWDLLRQHGRMEKGGKRMKGTPFYANEALFSAYAQDEIKRIGRIVKYKADYRSALARAAALNETLIRARMFVLLENGELAVEKRSAEGGSWEKIEGELEPALRRRIIEGLDGIMNLRFMGKALSRSTESCEDRYELRRNNNETISYAVRRNAGARFLEEFQKEQDIELSENAFLQLRHKTVHTVFAIPEPLARESLKYVEENYLEFKKNWMSEPPPKLWLEHPWYEVCLMCGLDFLPASLKR